MHMKSMKNIHEWHLYVDPPFYGICLSMKSWKILAELCFLFEFSLNFSTSPKLSKILTRIIYYKRITELCTYVWTWKSDLTLVSEYIPN